MNNILKHYKDYNKKLFEVKQKNQMRFNERTSLISKYKVMNKITQQTKLKEIFSYKYNNGLILRDKNSYEKKIVKSKVQNEIKSLSKIIENKIVCFTTPTINPNLNIDNNFYPIESESNEMHNEKLNQILKIQYKELQHFNKKLTKYHYKKEGKDITLKYKSRKVFELTSKLNIHQHRLDILENEEDLLEYIKSIIQKRNGSQIGRIEIALDEKYLELLLNSPIKIRVKNKYHDVNLFWNKRKKSYIYDYSIMGAGNFIYIRGIKDINKDKEHLTKYLFKYMLKASQSDSIENIIFHNLNFKQKQYSHNFFTNKLNKQELFKTASIIYKLLKQKNELLLEKDIDINSTIFETAKMLDNEILLIDNKKIMIKNSKNEYELLTTFFQYEKTTYKGYYSSWKRLNDKLRANGRLTYKEERDFMNNKNFEHYEKKYLEIEKERLSHDLKYGESIIEYEIKKEFRQNAFKILHEQFKKELYNEDIIKQPIIDNYLNRRKIIEENRTKINDKISDNLEDKIEKYMTLNNIKNYEEIFTKEHAKHLTDKYELYEDF